MNKDIYHPMLGLVKPYKQYSIPTKVRMSATWLKLPASNHLLKALAILVCVSFSVLFFGRWGWLALGVSAFILLKPRHQIALLVIVSLYPLGFGRMFGGVNLLLFSIIAPLLLLSFALRHIRVLSAAKANNSRLPRIGILLLILALFISFVRNPVGARSLFGGFGEGYGLKTYFDAAMCILIFFLAYASIRSDLIEPLYLVKVVLYSSLIIATLRLLTYFGLFEIPIFRGGLEYLEYEGTINRFTLSPRRIGGIGVPAALGLICTYVLWDARRIKILAYVAFPLTASLLVFGGGRTVFVGTGFALLMGIAYHGARAFFKMAVPLLVTYFFLASITLGGQRSVLESQMERLFRYQGAIERQVSRVQAYEELIGAWADNPIFGKGISSTQFEQRPSRVGVGGHGMYFSMVGLFGTLGLLFIILVLIYPVLKGLRYTLSKTESVDRNSNEYLAMSMCTLSLVMYSVVFGAGGSGYTNPNLFLLAGFLSAFLSQNKMKQRNSTIQLIE